MRQNSQALGVAGNEQCEYLVGSAGRKCSVGDLPEVRQLVRARKTKKQGEESQETEERFVRRRTVIKCIKCY